MDLEVEEILTLVDRMPVEDLGGGNLKNC